MFPFLVALSEAFAEVAVVVIAATVAEPNFHDLENKLRKG